MTDNYDAIDYWTNIFTPQGLDRMYMQNDELSAIVKWWSMDERLKGYEPEAFVRMLDDNRIRKTFVPSFKMWSYRKRAPLLSIEVSEIYALMQACPGRVGGMFGVDVTKGMAAVRELEFTVRELGFEAAHVHSYGLGMSLNHRDLYPFYAKCVELDIPVRAFRREHAIGARPPDPSRRCRAVFPRIAHRCLAHRLAVGAGTGGAGLEAQESLHWLWRSRAEVLGSGAGSVP
jgi:predicted TIM-barrel fold metal-dependent hydrolase